MKSRNDFTKDNEGEKQYQEYLRTYFAAMAMQGLLSNMSNKSFLESLHDKPENHIAEMSVECADALLTSLTGGTNNTGEK